MAFMRAPTGVPVTTFTIFQYPRGLRLWALRQMIRAREPLARAPGIRFHRLLGTGGGLGFSLLPDLSRYAMLAHWSAEQAADDFFLGSKLMAEYRRVTAEIWTVKLLARDSRGTWSAPGPFDPRPPELPPALPTVVLTHASLRLRGLLGFWRRAPARAHELLSRPGLRLALGVGELPWLRADTFSVWDGVDPAELDDPQLPRPWFRETLHARFSAIATQGRVHGHDPCGFQPDPKYIASLGSASSAQLRMSATGLPLPAPRRR